MGKRESVKQKIFPCHRQQESPTNPGRWKCWRDCGGGGGTSNWMCRGAGRNGSLSDPKKQNLSFRHLGQTEENKWKYRGEKA